ncbi:MAG: UDP-N-acetylmuramoyl-L-alanyl-D-glutamate--2,6-diaminopimelate ligase [Atopobiaceae bacterium]|nr:UDP-N-acetylmuramoyl-L-alanyl-D-glutamate--2,6-diaminopimelate ligase [Atopobiaceae bacterium]
MKLTNTHYSSLSQIASELKKAGLLTEIAGSDVEIHGASCDSRGVEPGQIFICKGAAFQPRFVESAQIAGAVAYLCDENVVSEVEALVPTMPHLVTQDIRSAMAHTSAEAWGHPDRELPVVGITGTKGKTTVAYMLRHMLDGAHARSHAATIGTIETFDGVEHFASKLTTPEAPDLWRHLRHAADAGLTMVMEVSSQALKYQRCDGLQFDVGAMLNIGHDHISPIEHPDFDDYLKSKLILLERSKHAVIKSDMDHAQEVWAAARHAGDVTSFSLNDESADIWATDIQAAGTQLRFTARCPWNTLECELGMAGNFNVENALAAIAIAHLLGVSDQDIVAGLKASHTPGRMELVGSADGQLAVLVDFAHNGDSFERLFESVKEQFPNYYVVSVFGATGGKGVERRFQMPPIAAANSDVMIFTEDDPGPEDVASICQDMVSVSPEGSNYEVILDREQAIARALELGRAAERPALVCLLGKGHEARQLRRDGAHSIKRDIELARELLAHMDGAHHGM